MNKTEYPRPQFVRKKWQNLNGEWLFAFDDQCVGMKEKWGSHPQYYDQKILVPFVYQCLESGINDQTPHDIVWYYREFDINKQDGQRAIIHFGAVDYYADIFVNGHHVGRHSGGHTSFSFDITEYLTNEKHQQLSVRVEDPHKDESIPRGKQFWQEKPEGIWYTNSTGIWQTVWLEVVEDVYFSHLRFTPLFDEGKVVAELELNEFREGLTVDCCIAFKGGLVAKLSHSFVEKRVILTVDLLQNYIFRTNFHHEGWSWTPETPNLFDVEFVLKQKENIKDGVSSYFGLRKIHQENGRIYLNNKPYYQKLILDQGYWPTGLMTAPTDDALAKDIQVAKEMGFNGCRKHQKTEEPRFLYWADKLGYLVWGECAAPAVFTHDSSKRLMQEWTEIVDRDYNHPCIVTWVPINESWGVPKISFDCQQQHFSQSLYHYLHSLDTTRLVISNDGWAMTETDICAIHHYGHGEEKEEDKYQDFVTTLSTREDLLNRPSTPWPIFANGFVYQGQPILLTEFGGIGFDFSGQKGWGYTSLKNEVDFIKNYRRIINAVYRSKGLWGFCYTQLTDVEQEINGLLTYDRQPKCDLKEIKKINDSFRTPYLV